MHVSLDGAGAEIDEPGRYRDAISLIDQSTEMLDRLEKEDKSP